MSETYGVNATLGELRVWAAKVRRDSTPDKDGAVGFQCDSEVRAAKLFEDLDAHIASGFMPGAWK